MLNFLVIGLAVWRISLLLVVEDGPYFAFSRLRHKLGIVDNAIDGRYVPDELGTHRRMLAGVFDCIYCMSLWISFFWAFLMYVWPDMSLVLAIPFALSSVVIVLTTWQGKNG